MSKTRSFVYIVILALMTSMMAACGSPAPAGISNLVLSTDKAGTNKTTTFAPTDTIYLSADVNQIPVGTSFDIKWYALNVAGQDPNTPFVTSNVVYNSGTTLSANTNSTTGGFPVGQYRVEVDMNGTKAVESDFTIQ